jgi:hypothetical protein
MPPGLVIHPRTPFSLIPETTAGLPVTAGHVLRHWLVQAELPLPLTSLEYQ